MTMGQIEELNRLVATIQPLPQGAIKVMRELNQENASASSVAAAIQCEPVMAAAVVRIANSSAIGLQRDITSVAESVAYLGFSTTKSLLMRFNIDAALPRSASGKGYDSGKLWVHSMTVAQVAEELARRAGRTDTNLALMAGLLHDIGKLVINTHYTHVLDEMFPAEATSQEGLLQRERRLLQADHAIIGAQLGQMWKLPKDLTEIIRLHHLAANLPPELSAEPRRALLCVHIANQLVKYRHAYCPAMEIDEVTPAQTSELSLPPWPVLLSDRALQAMIDRTVTQNGGTPESAAAVAA